jgi:hypothetical protein
MIAANYTAHFYCDCENCNCRPFQAPESGEYVGNSWSQVAKEARKDGWRISKNRERAYAPGHKINRHIE